MYQLYNIFFNGFNEFYKFFLLNQEWGRHQGVVGHSNYVGTSRELQSYAAHSYIIYIERKKEKKKLIVQEGAKPNPQKWTKKLWKAKIRYPSTVPKEIPPTNLGIISHQTKSVTTCPWLASLPAQPFPSRKMWEESTWIPWEKQFCQRFRHQIEIREDLEKAKRSLVESPSIQINLQWCLAAISIAIMNLMISASKTEGKKHQYLPRKRPCKLRICKSK